MVELMNELRSPARMLSERALDRLSDGLSQQQFPSARSHRFVNDAVARPESFQIQPFNRFDDARTLQVRQMKYERLDPTRDLLVDRLYTLVPVFRVAGQKVCDSNRLTKAHQRLASIL